MIVAIDSATDRLSVAVGSPAGPVACRELDGARRHTALLPGLVEEALGSLAASWADVVGVAVSDGPGSFTGLRVAAAWAKGVVRARNLPLYSASTLLVRSARLDPIEETVVGLGEAMRGESFAARYRFAADGAITTLASPRVVGEASDLAVAGDRVAREAPSAVVLLALLGRPGGAERIVDPTGWEPDYGRLAEAQVKWERAHGRPLAHPSHDEG